MSELTQIKPIEADQKELEQLRSDYQNLIVTPETLGDADKARLKLKNKRLEIQRQQKANNQVLKEIKKDNDDRADKLIAIIEPTENRLEAEIEAVKNEQKRREEEVRQKEINRIQAHRDRITKLAQNTARLAIVDNVDFIKAKIDELTTIGNDFEEYTQETNEAIELFIKAGENRIKQIEMEEAIAKEKKEKEAEGKARIYPATPEESYSPEKVAQHTQGGDLFSQGADVVIELEKPEPKPYEINEALQVPVNYSVMGFDFHIPTNLPEKEQDMIKSSIEKILGAMEI